jgi:cobalt-zinc-cadmium efflux system outer membrane protein
VAIERRLDLAGARQDVQTATAALDLGHQLRWLSVLGLGVVIERDPDNHKWLAGPAIEFSLPLFDQGQARVAALEAEERRREKRLVALAVDVRSQVRDTWTRLGAAQDAVAFYRSTILPLEGQIVDENQRLYSGMLIGVYDLLKSRQDEIAETRGYIGAMRDYWIARSDLERALAGPLPAASTGSASPVHRHLPLIAGTEP